jgi:asparagine N-glycosylation enzyme membrane subunit Stt3
MDYRGILQKRWVIIVLVLIVALGIFVRTDNYRWQYLRNIDSFTFARWMGEVVDNNGELPLRDELILAPNGLGRTVQLYPHVIFGAYSYILFSSFIPDLQLWEYLIFYPALQASLAAIPIYFIGKLLYNRKAGILAAFFIVFDFSNISRSLGGDPDTDAIVILVPLIVMAVFLYTYKYIESTKKFNPKFFLYSAIVGSLLGLWTHTWAGYWYVMWLMAGFLILKFLVDVIDTRRIKSAFKNHIHIFAAYLIFLLFVTLTVVPYFGYERIYTAPFAGIFDVQDIRGEENIEFPNVYISVAELQSPGGNLRDATVSIINRASALGGGPLLLISPFFLMIYALIYLVYSTLVRFVKNEYGEDKKRHIDATILLLVWFLGPFFAATVAIRFSLLLSAPMAIGSAIILAKIWNMIFHKEKFEE